MFKDLSLSEIYNKETPFENLVPGTGLVLIGTSTRGPAMTVIKAVDEEQVISIFGIDSELSNAYIEASLIGASDIYLIRVNGKHATTNVQDIMMLTSMEANDDANHLQYWILSSGNDRYITIQNKITGFNTSYYLTGKTIADLVTEINIDAVTYQSPVYATALQGVGTDSLIDEYFSEAQTDGAEIESVKEIPLEKIVEALEYIDAYPIGQVGILCKSFQSVESGEYTYSKIVEFVERKTKACTPCIVTIGADTKSVGSDMVYSSAKSFSTISQIECPVSEFVNVILAKPTIPGLHPSYVSNGVASYCGLISTLGYAESTTNKIIASATSDSLILKDDAGDDSAQLKMELAALGYVVLIDSKSKGQNVARVLRGVNLTRGFNKVVDPDSIGEYLRTIPAPMSNIGNVKLVQNLVYRLDDVLQQDEISQISTLKARISTAMKEIAEHIKDYQIGISETHEGYSKTYIVNLEIVPAGELESVALSIQTR